MYHYKFTGCFVDPQEFWNKIKKIRTSPLRISVPIPHVTFAYRPAFIDITISLSEGAEAVNSRGLDFKPVQHVTLQGVYGSATEDDEVITNVNPSDRLLIENSSF